jgi:F0F1-type ATP synthase assembly protein I
MARSSTTPNGLLVGSALSFVSGLLVVVSGKQIAETVQANSYEVIGGIQAIRWMVYAIGWVLCAAGLVGLIIGVIVVVRKKR